MGQANGREGEACTTALDRITEPVLLRAQWNQMHGPDPWPPEKRLLLGVLEEARLTLRRRPQAEGTRRARDWADAADWVRSDGDDDDAFTFTSICHALGLNCERVRLVLLSGSGPRGKRAHRRRPAEFTR